MDNIEILFKAIEKDELTLLLRGDVPYKIEPSQYSPGIEPTDVGKVLSRFIYKGYKIQPSIKEKFESTLMTMLNQNDFDVYVVVLYIVSELFKEKNGLSPFQLDMTSILPKIRKEIKKRKKEFQEGVSYPDSIQKINLWDNIERFNSVCEEEYGISLL